MGDPPVATRRDALAVLAPVAAGRSGRGGFALPLDGSLQCSGGWAAGGVWDVTYSKVVRALVEMLFI